MARKASARAPGKTTDQALEEARVTLCSLLPGGDVFENKIKPKLLRPEDIAADLGALVTHVRCSNTTTGICALTRWLSAETARHFRRRRR